MKVYRGGDCEQGYVFSSTRYDISAPVQKSYYGFRIVMELKPF